MDKYVYLFYAYGKPVTGVVLAADETEAQRKLLEPYIKTPRALQAVLSAGLWLFLQRTAPTYDWVYTQAEWFNQRVKEADEYEEYLRLKAKFG